MKITPSFIISGTASGSGKTTMSLGLMAAFKEMGYTVQAFKCGPDFIDPGLHQLVTGTVSRNLDLWMAGEAFTKETFWVNSKLSDIAIIEGVMGMFDGGISSTGSLAELLDIPTILVLDVRSMAESAAAIVKGFETLQPQANLKGVILNRVASMRHLQLVSNAICKYCTAEVLGFLPRTVKFSIPSRHLGLLTGDETPLSKAAIKLLGKTVAEHIDLERIIALCDNGPEAASLPFYPPKTAQCRIAVARDLAFCFYYEDNFDILRRAGAELVFFSPISDTKLPDNMDAVYLGGGYPELYAKELSHNRSMLSSIHDWIEDNRIIYAECGGFMYLTKGIMDYSNTLYKMVGTFPVIARMQKKRTSLGYQEALIKTHCCFGPPGTLLRGHQFHYSTIDEMPKYIKRAYSLKDGSMEGYTYKKTLGSYIHFHFGFRPQVVQNFINYC